MLKIALIGIVFFHPKEMLFNTYTYTLNKILIVTSAPSSLQLILLKFETVRSVRALLSVKAPWWWCESLYLLLQNIQLGIWRAMSWNHVSGTVPPFLVVTDIIQLSSFSPHNVKKKVISLKNCPCLFHHRFSSYPSLSCMRAHLCPTLCDPMDCSPSGSSVHGIFQERILEWVDISFSMVSSRPRDQIHSLLSSQVDSLPLSHQGSPSRCYTSTHVQWNISKKSSSCSPLYLSTQLLSIAIKMMLYYTTSFVV